MEEIEVGFPTATKTLEEKFEKFLKNYYYKDILRVIRGYPEERSLIVDFDVLDNYDFSLAEEVINNPDEAIKACEKAIRNMELPIDLPSVKINVRFQNLPSTHKFLIRELRSNNVGKLISVEGIVRKSTDVRPKLVIGAFECQVCGNIIRISQDGDKLKQPYLCDSCERKGPFNLLIDESVFIDSQKILIQESLEDLRGGEHPQQLTIYLEDDLTGKIFPGDRIEVVGILRARRNKKTTFVYPNQKAIRVITQKRHLLFLKKFGWMYSTSANLSGKKFDINFALKNADVIVRDKKGFFEDKVSRIIKLGKKRMLILRK